MAKLKSESGQAQLLLSIAFLALATTTALAYNATVTGNITGAPVHTGNSTSEANLTTQTFTAPISVYANTSLSLDYSNSTLNATLTLDNGTLLSGQTLELHFNDSLLSTETTDTSGTTSFSLFDLSGPSTLTVSYPGSSSSFFNPTSSTISVSLPEAPAGPEQNQTAPNATQPQLPANTLTLQTDKTTYHPEENITFFGSLLVNSTPANDTIHLSVLFNSSQVHSADIEVLEGDYSLVTSFNHSGNYTATASHFRLNLSATAHFTLGPVSNRTNRTQNLTLQPLETSLSSPVQAESPVEVNENESVHQIPFIRTASITNNNNVTLYNQTVSLEIPETSEVQTLTISEIQANQTLTRKISYTVPLTLSTSELLVDTYSQTASLSAPVTVENITLTLSIPPLENLKLSEPLNFTWDNQSAVISIPVLEENLTLHLTGNLSLVSSVILSQGQAEVGKPVPWTMTFRFQGFPDTYTLHLPEDAYSVAVKYREEIISTNSSLNLTRFKETPSRLATFSQTKDITAEFFTPAPQKEETETSTGRRIRIQSNASLHYSNVTASTSLPGLETGPRLYRVVNDTREDVTDDSAHNVQYLDTDSDGLYDKMTWTVPRLSEETYEIDLTIINVQSYPTVGGNWTVRFETTGIADLLITPVDTTFAEKSEDDLSTENDLDFTSLEKGGQEVEGYFYLVKPEDLIKLKE